MPIALIGCMVMNREIGHLIAQSPHVVRCWWLRQGFHDTPDRLRACLQETVDQIERENQLLPAASRFDAIVLAYGLCSNGVVGLRSRTLPIIVPRCDDCISLFLGSADRYRQLFDQFSGTYWYNRGWIEQAFTPSMASYRDRRAQYAQEYGEENANYLMECTCNWMEQYRTCGYITCCVGECPGHREYAQQAAKDFGWEYREVEGDLSYLEALVNGPWDDGRFLTCPPGHRIEPDYSTRKMRAEPC